MLFKMESNTIWYFSVLIVNKQSQLGSFGGNPVFVKIFATATHVLESFLLNQCFFKC